MATTKHTDGETVLARWTNDGMAVIPSKPLRVASGKKNRSKAPTRPQPAGAQTKAAATKKRDKSRP
jgi:hypothetical protein